MHIIDKIREDAERIIEKCESGSFNCPIEIIKELKEAIKLFSKAGIYARAVDSYLCLMDNEIFLAELKEIRKDERDKRKE